MHVAISSYVAYILNFWQSAHVETWVYVRDVCQVWLISSRRYWSEDCYHWVDRWQSTNEEIRKLGEMYNTCWRGLVQQSSRAAITEQRKTIRKMKNQPIDFILNEANPLPREGARFGLVFLSTICRLRGQDRLQMMKTETHILPNPTAITLRTEQL